MTDAVPRPGRRAAARRARRRRQLRNLALVLGALALVAVALAVYLALRDTPEPKATAGQVGRTQNTLSLQVQGPNGAGVANALLAHDPSAEQGAVVLVPPQVLVSVPGSGSVPYGRVILSGTAQASRGALSDIMGVTVDQGWIMDLPTLARLVDELGGIRVELDTQVVQGDKVVLEPGVQQLDGAAAGVLVSYIATGEQEQVRLARIQQVLDGILGALPTTQDELAHVLSGLGDRSVSTQPPQQLAGFLRGLAADSTAGQLQYDVLPVIDQDPGGGIVSFRADEPALRSLVDRLLAPSVPAGARAGGNRFLVLNGVGTPGLGEAVRGRLVREGLVFLRAQNAPDFGVTRTQVLVPDASGASIALGRKVARALGLPESSVKMQDIGTSADVIVLVGADFTDRS